MSSLEQLCYTCPAWVEILKKEQKKLSVSATAQRPSGLDGRKYELSIKLQKDNRVAVFEMPEAGLLPRRCVERHINIDSSFCLHFNSTTPIQSPETACQWWRSLGFFLNHQDHAARRRKWPMFAELSHGDDAAITQLKMEEIAGPLGWKDEEVIASIFRKRGWLAGPLPRLTKDKRGLVNVRTPCPRGCTRKHHPYRKASCQRGDCVEGCKKIHKAILRAECPNRAVVECLVLLERQRRNEEAEFYKDLKKDGVACCETMDGCPLFELGAISTGYLGLTKEV